MKTKTTAKAKKPKVKDLKPKKNAKGGVRVAGSLADGRYSLGP